MRFDDSLPAYGKDADVSFLVLDDLWKKRQRQLSSCGGCFFGV